MEDLDAVRSVIEKFVSMYRVYAAKKGVQKKELAVFEDQAAQFFGVHSWLESYLEPLSTYRYLEDSRDEAVFIAIGLALCNLYADEPLSEAEMVDCMDGLKLQSAWWKTGSHVLCYLIDMTHFDQMALHVFCFPQEDECRFESVFYLFRSRTWGMMKAIPRAEDELSVESQAVEVDRVANILENMLACFVQTQKNSLAS